MKTRGALSRWRQPASPSGTGWSRVLGALGVGSALVYFFDPRTGRGRWVRTRDRARHAARAGALAAVKAARDISNRARGAAARLRAALWAAPPSDQVLVERVRAALGRHSSHPGAIEVLASNGEITLCGPVLEREHDRVGRAVARVRGVRAVADRLERHVHPDGVPGLQESRPHPPDEGVLRCAGLMKRNVQTAMATETVATAAETMALANVGFLPVCDHTGRVLGTITDRDIVVRAIAAGRDPLGTQVDEVMTAQVVACRPDDDIAEAERAMARYQVARLVITDEGGTLCGVISLSDIAEREPARRAARTLRAVAAREAPRA